MEKKVKKEKRNSVAIWLVMTDGLMKGKVPLQRRSDKEPTFAYICQPTWNGWVEDGETLMDAVKREATEELGEEFANSVDFNSLELFDQREFNYKDDKAVCNSYRGRLSIRQIDLISMHDFSEPEFVFIGLEDIANIKPFDKEINAKEQLTLFKDQYEALLKLFQ